MTELEKVIQHFEDCIKIADCQINHNWVFVRTEILRDAVALLKAQEAVEPEVDVDVWRCGKCWHPLEHQEMLGSNILFHEQYAYCPNCGRAVKWE